MWVLSTFVIIHQKKRSRPIKELYNPRDRLWDKLKRFSYDCCLVHLLTHRQYYYPPSVHRRLLSSLLVFRAQTDKLHERKRKKLNELNFKDFGLLGTHEHLAYVSKTGKQHADVSTANTCGNKLNTEILWCQNSVSRTHLKERDGKCGLYTGGFDMLRLGCLMF